MQPFKFKLILLAFLIGCTPEVAEWTPAENPKVNKVERTVFMHTIHYPAHASHLESREKRNLLKFLELNASSPSAVNITLIEYGGHSEKRIKDIQRELFKYGISFDAVEVEHETPNHNRKGREAASGVELVVERYLVIPPSCGDFSQPLGESRQAYVHSNFGCAVTANLGMMVANPKDLIKGRSLGSSDGTVIAAGVDRYRKDQVKTLIDTSTTVAPGTLTSSSTSATSTTTSSASTGGSY